MLKFFPLFLQHDFFSSHDVTSTVISTTTSARSSTTLLLLLLLLLSLLIIISLSTISCSSASISLLLLSSPEFLSDSSLSSIRMRFGEKIFLYREHERKDFQNFSFGDFFFKFPFKKREMSFQVIHLFNFFIFLIAFPAMLRRTVASPGLRCIRFVIRPCNGLFNLV